MSSRGKEKKGESVSSNDTRGGGPGQASRTTAVQPCNSDLCGTRYGSCALGAEYVSKKTKEKQEKQTKEERVEEVFAFIALHRIGSHQVGRRHSLSGR